MNYSYRIQCNDCDDITQHIYGTGSIFQIGIDYSAQ